MSAPQESEGRIEGPQAPGSDARRDPYRWAAVTGAALLLVALVANWYVVTPAPPITTPPEWVTGADYLGRVDLLLIAAGLAGLVSALPRVPFAPALRIAAGTGAAAVTLRALAAPAGEDSRIDVVGGGWLALGGATALALAGLLALPIAARLRPGRWQAVVAPCLLGALALPTLLGAGATAAHLIGTADPNLGGWAGAVNADALALYTGQQLYQDPADGFVGQLYTPLHSAITAVLHHIHLWNGWPGLVGFASSAAIAGVAGRLATGPVGRCGWRIAEAVFFAATAWWLMTTLQFDMTFSGHADQLAWGLALAGVVVIAAGAPARRPVIAGFILLSAAFWTKQSTIVASLAISGWLAAAAAFGPLRPGWVLRVLAAHLAANLLVLGVLNLLTGGWEFYFNFLLAAQRPTGAISPELDVFLRAFADEIRLNLTVSALFAAALWAVAAVARGRPGRGAPAALFGSVPARTGGALLIFVAIALPATAQFRRVPGSFDNQELGLAWGLVLLAAAGWRAARATPGGRTGAIAVAVALTLLAYTKPGGDIAGRLKAALPPINEVGAWGPVPLELRAAARDGLVWHPVHGELNAQRGVVYMNFNALGDLLAVGRTSGWTERTLLERRPDTVTLFPPLTSTDSENPYFTGNGRYEHNYFHKLNAVMLAKYEQDPGRPAGLLSRRPGPDPAAWMNTCFSPFTVAGIELRINRGGGFWCPQRGGGLRLREALAPYSDVRSEEELERIGGSLGVELPRPGGAAAVGVELDGGDLEWVMRVTRGAAKDETRVEVTRNGAVVATLPATDVARWRVELAQGGDNEMSAQVAAPGRLRLTLPALGGGAILRLGATRDSDARFGLTGLRTG